jgi:hypothetical protein
MVITQKAILGYEHLGESTRGSPQARRGFSDFAAHSPRDSSRMARLAHWTFLLWCLLDSDKRELELLGRKTVLPKGLAKRTRPHHWSCCHQTRCGGRGAVEDRRAWDPSQGLVFQPPRSVLQLWHAS